MRVCVTPHCGADISHRLPNAKHCRECARRRSIARTIASRKKRQARTATVDAPRVCLDCPTDISDRPRNTRRCRPCAHQATKQQRRDSVKRSNLAPAACDHRRYRMALAILERRRREGRPLFTVADGRLLGSTLHAVGGLVA